MQERIQATRLLAVTFVMLLTCLAASFVVPPPHPGATGSAAHAAAAGEPDAPFGCSICRERARIAGDALAIDGR
ncbi:MAG: hypothetical protein AAF682_26380 [Planctomycetota bacterium]